MKNKILSAPFTQELSVAHRSGLGEYADSYNVSNLHVSKWLNTWHVHGGDGSNHSELQLHLYQYQQLAKHSSAGREETQLFFPV